MKDRKYRQLIIAGLRKERGESYEQVAAATGLAPSSIWNYENDSDKDISLFALCRLAEYYNVTTDYMLGLTTNRKEFNTPVEKLHLTDEAIQSICSGKINTWLLSEIIAHPAFRRLMVDAEIYVDRNAELFVQNMNTYLEALRAAAIGEEGADPDDLWMKTLNSARIDEDEYFSHVLYKDMMEILKPLREAHKPDMDTADDASARIPQKMKELFRIMRNTKGSEQDRAIDAFCHVFGLKRSKYTDEEWAAYLKIANNVSKAETVKTFPKRGKSAGSHSRGGRSGAKQQDSGAGTDSTESQISM